MSKIVEYTCEPCPICGHKGWCGKRHDGLVLCKRASGPHDLPGFTYKGMANDGTTSMYVEVGKEYVQPRTNNRGEHSRHGEFSGAEPSTRPDKVNPIDRVDPKWLTVNYPRLVANLSEERRDALAEALGLPSEALEMLAIGWWPDRRWWKPETQQYEGEPGCWTFPEYDAQERIIGLGLRWPMGQKGQLTRGRRGLSLPVGWREAPDPVLIVEGPSDVLAGRWLGLNVIGRPNNSGGAELLAHVCRNRRVIVVGENDRKPDGRWPGKEGAEAVAEKLAATWSWPVPVAFPPDDLKDLREWVVAQRTTPVGQMDAAERTALAEQFLETVLPPNILLHSAPRTRRGGRVAVRAFRWTDPVEAGPFFTDKLDLDSAKARAKFAATVAEAEPLVDVEAVQKQLLRLNAPDPPPRRREAAVAHAQLPVAANIVTDRAETARPQVQGSERQLRDIRTDALAALLGSNDPPRLFTRSGGIARVTIVQDDQNQAAPQIQQLDADALRGELTNAADWFTLHHSKDRGDYLLPDLPPLAVARDLLALPAIDLPPLVAIITCPTFGSDGGLIVNGGYDQASALWHHPTLIDLPAIPKRPSDDEIVAARDVLADIIAEFPFIDEASRANALALMLLPFVRPLIDGPTPLHAVDAPTPGTGKGLLVQACMWPALGYSLDIRSGARDPDEWRKRITSELVAGKPVIGFDNATTRLDSEHLAAALTATMWTDRVLGQTRVVTIPNRSVWVCTGNNLAFSRELARRVVWVRLDAKVEVPEQRTGFRYPNLTAHVREHRTALVAAALTLCRAWLASGCPAGKQIMGSFECYAQTLGGILDVAGVEGFMVNAAELRRQVDTETGEWRAFVHGWWERWHDAWVGVSDLADLLWEADGKRTDLLPSVVKSEKQRGIVTQLGMRLARKRDCILAGLRVLVGDKTDHKDRLVYRLVPTSSEPPQGRHEVGTEVGNRKPRAGNNLEANADLCRPFGHPLLFPGANKTHAQDVSASFCPDQTRSNGKRSAKVGIAAQVVPESDVTAADLGADLPPTFGSSTERSAFTPPPATPPTPAAVQWCAGDSDHLAPGIVELAQYRDGWTPSAWRDRLLQLADRCADLNPERAAELRMAAAAMTHEKQGGCDVPRNA